MFLRLASCTRATSRSHVSDAVHVFMTSLLKETAGIACPTALLLSVHHRTCALLGSITALFSQLLLDSSDWHVGVTGCFVGKPVAHKCKHPAYTIAVQIRQSLFVNVL